MSIGDNASGDGASTGEGVPMDEELEDAVEDGMMRGDALDDGAGVGGCR